MKKIFFIELILVGSVFIIPLNKHFIFLLLDFSNTLRIYTIIEVLFLGLLLLSVLQMIYHRAYFDILDAVNQCVLMVLIFFGIRFLSYSFNFHSLRTSSEVLELLLPYYGIWFIFRIIYGYMRAYLGFSLFKSKYSRITGFLSGFSLVFVASLIPSFYIFTYLPFSAITLFALFFPVLIVNYLFFGFWLKTFTPEFRLGMKRGIIVLDASLTVGFIVILPSIFFALGA